MKTTAIIPHPELSLLRWPDPPQIIDERTAVRLAASYEQGAYMAIERVFRLDVGDWREAHVLHERYRPQYSEVRDYLIHECNVPLVLAARVALRMTMKVLA
jgi:hypothetical protein